MTKSNLKLSDSTASARQRRNLGNVMSRFSPVAASREGVLREDLFHSILMFERRRAERSERDFALMLLELRAAHKNGNRAVFVGQIASVISTILRETDVMGWYEDGRALAVIFTEINVQGEMPIIEVLRARVMKELQGRLDNHVLSNLVLTVELFPQKWDIDSLQSVTDTKLYSDGGQEPLKKRSSKIIKRVVDVVGSAAMLIVLSPVLATIALLIKLTSEGPIVFRQERLGKAAKAFQCRKFRTMYTDNDSKVHREYIKHFIAGTTEGREAGPEPGATVYKITDDPRVTPLGKFLRRTSLDEFPQLWNVLRGEMSLVGPRPPLPYEFEVYGFWHRSRIFEAKPGLTGLWQVCGRSRTCFDDMVRLDLRYARSWSLWLDLKILLATPRAVFTGDGAF